MLTASFADGIWGRADGSDLKSSLKVNTLYKVLDGWSAEEWGAVLKKSVFRLFSHSD